MKSWLLAFALILCPALANAQLRENPSGCSNDECFTSAGNLLLASGLIAAVMALRWLAPRTARSYLGRTSGDVQFGGFVDRSKLAAVDYDLSEFPDVGYGVDTGLALAALKDGSPTLLRYKLIANQALVKTWRLRLSVGAGVAVEKFMEAEPVYPGIPLQLLWHQNLSSAWKLKALAEVYFLKKPVYRGSVQAIWFGKEKELVHPSFGLLSETNTLQGVTTHYVLLGFWM